MSVTSIPLTGRYILWGKAAGRCQFRGCNKSLFRDALTQGEFNQAYIAHIVADVPGGPRGDAIRSDLLKDDIGNLMLMCDEHHRLIDKVDVAGHPESLLLEMKKEHEDRIETVASINPNMQSHIVTYKANVGTNSPVVSYESVREYLLPDHYPAMPSAFDLGLSNSPLRDRNEGFWNAELENLVTQFNEQIRPRLRKGEIEHLSIFAFAPIPLLIKLGTLLNDMHNAVIHQPVRIPKTWNLDDVVTPNTYSSECKEGKGPLVALNISISAPVVNERITRVLGDDCTIYTLTIDTPSVNFLKSKKQLMDFNLEVRKLLNEIVAKHGAEKTLHIFPAMPIATAIALGRVWMPKSDMPFCIYDQNTANDGFTRAFEIVNA